MKILLIAPATGPWRGIGKHKIFNGKTFRFSMLSLLSVASITPPQHKITIIDEQFEDLPLDKEFDLVGITSMTASALRAYELCKIFSDKNTPIVMGGFHATFNQQEALENADAVVVGPAYGAWEKLLEDIEQNNLQKIYHGKLDPSKIPPFPKQLLNKSKYLSIHTTYATLGCTNTCNFCSISRFYDGIRYERPIFDIIDELSSFKAKFFMFIDDNLTQDREYILELCKGLETLNKKWVTQVSVEIADDEEILTALEKSGCIGVFIGLETFNPKALSSQDKELKDPNEYAKAVEAFHRHGMFVEAGLIFGFDHDTKAVFQNTLAKIEEIGIDVIQTSILTPLPGTKLYEEMQYRIFDKNWEHYDYKYPVYYPKQMTPEELKNGFDWITNRFYSSKLIWKRTIRWLFKKKLRWRLWYPLLLNIAYYGRVVRFKIKGQLPA